MTEKEKQIANEQLNKCIEWVAFNLQPTYQRPINQQLEKMRKECDLSLGDKV
jgi:hypothetical protein